MEDDRIREEKRGEERRENDKTGEVRQVEAVGRFDIIS